MHRVLLSVGAFGVFLLRIFFVYAFHLKMAAKLGQNM
jgi:hypothetical protein